MRVVMVWALFMAAMVGCGESPSETAEPAEATPDLIVTTYESDDTVFPNPERGFYRYTTLTDLDPQIGQIRDEEGITLIWGRIHMPEYRENEFLPAAFLTAVERGLEIARDQGMKVIVRGSYGSQGPGGDYTTYTDPEERLIRNHIAQLAPIFAAHEDVIALFEAGFVGPWGEWHTTDLANDPDRARDFLGYLLQQTPADRMVLVRYPLLKQQVFALAGGGFDVVTEANAYSGEPVARVGHHNDCFLSSATDVGTYDRGGMDRAGEEAYLAAETLHTVFGGESCGDYELNDCASAMGELEALHATYLNSGWHPDVLSKWEAQGCMTEVRRRLGARFVLQESGIGRTATAGGELPLRLELVNEGFAPLYNERRVDVVLTHDQGLTWRLPIDADPRRWKPAERVIVEALLPLPVDLPAGLYSAALHLADPAPALQMDPRYAIRVANRGLWDEATGLNHLAGGIRIDAP